MVLRFLALLALILAGAASAQPVTADQLRRHIDILASDAFEGREPGSAGEAKVIDYIAGQYRELGLEPAGENGWLQPVALVIRAPDEHQSRWKGRGPAIELGPEELILLGRDAELRIEDAPVVFAGHGAVLPERKIDQLAGVDLKGAVAIILYEGPEIDGFPSFADRVKAVAAKGAAAVIGIMDAKIPWAAVQNAYEAGQNRLAGEQGAPIQGAIAQEAAARLVEAAGRDLESLLNAAPGPAFTPVRLNLRATLEVTTKVRSLTSNNVLGRLRGTGGSKESLLYLGHWDHLGICRPPAQHDRVCNGAVDNASGIAVMIEIARALAAGPKLSRDVIFLATTAEELGLLGAHHFAAQPTVPLKSIVAAINLDTVAIAPKGQKVAVIGRGLATLDALIDETIRDAGREIDGDSEADAFVERQDGWALARVGVPAIMIGGSFSDMKQLGAFLSGAYHQPEDNPGPGLVLGGASEDANLLIALGRKLADPARFPTSDPLARP
jgi:Zn-dependent M28 family amino/carboxypeptidase